MESVRRAATAPAEPSPQDFKVAAAAQRMMTEAQRDLDAAKLDQMQGRGETDGAGRRERVRRQTRRGEKAQAQASSAAVASAMQAYQSASALVRSVEIARRDKRLKALRTGGAFRCYATPPRLAPTSWISPT